MSPQKVADAVHSAPFLTHAVSHHGQVTLIPPDNAGRMRQARPKKSQRRTDRTARSEEEARFIIGLKSPHTGVSRGRRPVHQPARQEQANEDRGYSRNSDIPDYPPPSFLEAISTPPLSVCPSTTTLVNDPQSITPSLPGCAEDLSRPFTPPSSAEFSFNSSNEPPFSRSNSETESEEFVEVAERSSPQATDGQDQFRERVATAWRQRRGVEFPKPTSPLLETCSPREPVPDCPTAIPVTPPKRRHLSLSPLRTLFPSRPLILQDRALSAHPAPKNSPYSLSHSSMSFFKSTTSLRLPSMSTSSFLRLPTTPPSSTTSSIKNEGTSPRKMFPLKGKEKARASLDESWEVVESMDDDFPLSDSGKSSTSNQTYSHSPKTSPLSSKKKPPLTPPPPSPPTNPQPPESPSQSPSVHPLSLRDRKIPFVNRPVRRSPPTPRPAPPAPPVPVAGTGPPVVTVRTRKVKPPPPPPPKRLTHSIASSPLGADSWKADDAEEARSMFIYQRALETPLPPTPVDTTHFDLNKIVGSTPSYSPRNSMARPRMDLISEEPPDLQSRPKSTTFFRLPVRLDYQRHIPLQVKISSAAITTPDGRSRVHLRLDHHEHPVENQCPEGLLINLDEPTEEPTRASTPQPDGLQSLSVASSANGSSYNLSNESLPSGRTSPLGFSSVTELDVLASHLADGHSNGMNYDNLLLISEFLGPGVPRGGDEPPRTPSPEATNPRPSLLGRIEVERRRTTKDGRTKLKLLLLDITVDKCGICLFQFKSGELAAMGAVCHHAFHEECLGRWTANKKSCPMCRGPL
ncbi:hypothetical protein BD779DRAFT_1672250 [Infundibulicybe gibba]|nr:hypothetical protein BD779DRAFT_1672250 [Infundibulicybe gibba]